MKRSLMICAALLMLVNVPQAKADNVELSLDLKNNFRNNALGGGTWELFARKIETGSGDQGDFGIAGIRALISGINEAGITFAAGTGHMTTGGPYVQTLSNGVVEIVYGQDLTGTVVNGVGVNANANRGRLIASGTWGDTSFPNDHPRPLFGADEDGNLSEVNFLGGVNATPNPAAIQVTNVSTVVVTLGDINTTGANAGIYNNLDAVGLLQNLPPNSPPYNPAVDINNDGLMNNLDAVQFLPLLQRPLAPTSLTAAVAAVPEPTSFGLAVFAAMGLIARRRRV